MSGVASHALRVLVVDDEAPVRESLGEWLRVSGIETALAASAGEARSRLAGGAFDVVVTDLRMPGGDGMGLLDHVLDQHRDTPVILLTAHADVSLAVDAMRRGAHDFLEKPYDADHLLNVVMRAGEHARLKRDLALLRRKVGELTGIDTLLPGTSPAIRALRQKVLTVAAAPVDVIVAGGPSAGSERVARAIHAADPRGGAISTIDCAALTEEQVEVALAEACDGARRDMPGTLIITALEAMGPHARERMARLFAGGRAGLRRIGLTGDGVEADGSHIALWSHLMDAQVLRAPPLDERPEDMPAVFGILVSEAAMRAGLDAPPPGIELMGRLASDAGLRCFVRLRSLAMRHVLGLDDRADSQGVAPSDLRSIMARVEGEIIKRTLEAHGGNKAAAARVLGLARRTFGERLERLGPPGG